MAFTYSSSSVDSSNQIYLKKLSSDKSKCKAYKSDASIFEDCEKLIEKVITDFGNIDVLINNAGITKDNLLMRMTEEDFDSE